jgi:hypothetical protein
VADVEQRLVPGFQHLAQVLQKQQTAFVRQLDPLPNGRAPDLAEFPGQRSVFRARRNISGADAVHLDVSTAFGTHYDPLPWPTVLKSAEPHQRTPD